MSAFFSLLVGVTFEILSYKGRLILSIQNSARKPSARVRFLPTVRLNVWVRSKENRWHWKSVVTVELIKPEFKKRVTVNRCGARPVPGSGGYAALAALSAADPEGPVREAAFRASFCRSLSWAPRTEARPAASLRLDSRVPFKPAREQPSAPLVRPALGRPALPSLIGRSVCSSAVTAGSAVPEPRPLPRASPKTILRWRRRRRGKQWGRAGGDRPRPEVGSACPGWLSGQEGRPLPRASPSRSSRTMAWQWGSRAAGAERGVRQPAREARLGPGLSSPRPMVLPTCPMAEACAAAAQRSWAPPPAHRAVPAPPQHLRGPLWGRVARAPGARAPAHLRPSPVPHPGQGQARRQAPAAARPGPGPGPGPGGGALPRCRRRPWARPPSRGE